MLKLVRFLKGYYRSAVLGPFFKAVEAVFELFAPLVIASIIDKGIGEGDNAYILSMGLVLVLLSVVGFFSTVIAHRLAANAASGIATNLRSTLFDRINSFAPADLDKIGIPSLITRITGDVNQIQQAVNLFIRIVARAPFVLIGSCIMAGIIEPKMTLIFLGASLTIAGVLYLTMSRSVPYIKKSNLGLDKISLLTRENVAGVRVVRAFSREQEETNSFVEGAEKLAANTKRAAFISALVSPLSFVIINMCIVLILYFGSFSVQSDTLTQGEIIALINYMSQILIVLNMLAFLIVSFTKGSQSAKRINEVLQTTPSITFPQANDKNSGSVGCSSANESDLDSVAHSSADESDLDSVACSSADEKNSGNVGCSSANESDFHGVACSSANGKNSGSVGCSSANESGFHGVACSSADGKNSRNVGCSSAGKSGFHGGQTDIECEKDFKNVPLLRFEGVDFSYPGSSERSLSGIDFCLGRGESLGIIGRTGSGKTSIINLLQRFYDVDGGAVRIFGRDIRTFDEASLRALIAIVPQKAVLFSGTLRENLTWGDENATDEQLWDALSTAQAADFVKKLAGGLDAEVLKGGRNFSGGQRQRLTIARALVKNAPILVLDDSASALDFATDAKLRRAIAKISKEKAVITISQRAPTIMHSTKILVLENGTKAGLGTHKDLMETCGIYREIYETQVEER